MGSKHTKKSKRDFAGLLVAFRHRQGRKLKLGRALSQAECAKYFGMSKRTLQNWEIARSRPTGLALQLITKAISPAMKRLLTLALTCAALAAPAQKAEDFRIVDGKLYNIQKSTNWTWIAHAGPVVTPRGKAFRLTLEVSAVRPDGEVWANQTISGFDEKNEWIDIAGDRFILKNFTGAYVGMKIKELRAMRIGPKPGDQDEFIYDCGTPNVKGKP